MNIVYFLGSFPRLSQSFVLNEIYELEQNGHNVAVCAIHDPITHRNAGDLLNLAADKGYDEKALRKALRGLDIRPLTNIVSSLRTITHTALVSTMTVLTSVQ